MCDAEPVVGKWVVVLGTDQEVRKGVRAPAKAKAADSIMGAEGLGHLRGDNSLPIAIQRFREGTVHPARGMSGPHLHQHGECIRDACLLMSKFSLLISSGCQAHTGWRAGTPSVGNGSNAATAAPPPP